MGAVAVWRRWMAGVALLGGVAACARGVYHRVQPGENLYRISKAYGVPASAVAAANHLPDASRLEIGQRLYIPQAHRAVPVDVVTPRAHHTSSPPNDARRTALALSWPVDSRTVTSPFGQRGHGFHDGIDISAPKGSPVHAAQDGEVIYSDALRGYGNLIILRHEGGFATVYAHNEHNQAHEGQHVRRGEVIGSVGDSGRTASANLHFEVRQDNIARDPLDFLPRRTQTAATASH